MQNPSGGLSVWRCALPGESWEGLRLLLQSVNIPLGMAFWEDGRDRGMNHAGPPLPLWAGLRLLALVYISSPSQ